MPIPMECVEALAVVLAVVWLVLLPLVVWRVRVGRIFGHEPWGRRCGRAALLLAFLALPPCVYAAPSHLVRVVYGNYPLGDRDDGIQPGMTAAEVRAALGPPHKVLGHGGAEGWSWIYWRDSFGYDYVGVSFADNGRVSSAWVP